jgi:hypothetical protein
MRSVRFEARPQGMLKQCRPDFPAPHGSWPPCRRPAGPPYPRAIRPPGGPATRAHVVSDRGPPPAGPDKGDLSPLEIRVGGIYARTSRPRESPVMRPPSEPSPPSPASDTSRSEPRIDPPWVRLVLVFLLGVLVGVVLIAGTRELPRGGSRPESGSPRSLGSMGPVSVQGVADARRAADAAGSAAGAASGGSDAIDLTGSLPSAPSHCSAGLDVRI